MIELVDNPPLRLFYEVMLDLSGAPFPLQGVDQPGLRRRMLRFHLELAEAIRAGDASAAARIATEYLAQTRRWIR